MRKYFIIITNKNNMKTESEIRQKYDELTNLLLKEEDSDMRLNIISQMNLLIWILN